MGYPKGKPEKPTSQGLSFSETEGPHKEDLKQIGISWESTQGKYHCTPVSLSPRWKATIQN